MTTATTTTTSTTSSVSLEEENRRLRSENEKLKEELQLKDELIASLQRKINMGGRNGSSRNIPECPMDDSAESPGKPLRNSTSMRKSTESSSSSSPPPPSLSSSSKGVVGSSSVGGGGGSSRLPDMDDDGESRRSYLSHRNPSRDAESVSSSLRPPSRNTAEMRQPLAPTTTEKSPSATHKNGTTKATTTTPTSVLLSHNGNILVSGIGSQLGHSIAEGNEDTDADGDESKLPLNTGSSGRTLIKSKGAIKALPRELSIYNSKDDEVTVYSIDDGMPTYELEKTEMRDAYNARGIYTGTVSRKEQMPHGRGKMEYHIAGRVYDGDWHMGHWHGYGMIQNAIGDVYEGRVVNDLKEGEGRLTYADGRVFEGRFKEDEAVKGTITFPDGARYIGELHNGARHGQGTYYFADGSRYEGQSVMNIFEGKGKMIWTDGGWYEGEWSQGEIHGYGMEIRPDGTLRHNGRWSKGVPIRS